MKHSIIILIIGISCGLWQWFISPQSARQGCESTHVQWPNSFEGESLTSIPMTAVEFEFSKDFPGELANFRCADQQVILRHVTRATRKLHPAADCFRASGYHIGKVKIHTSLDLQHWSGCVVSKAGKKFFLRERIVKVDDHQSAWTDVSSWYWHALTAPKHGPWLAITVISEVND